MPSVKTKTPSGSINFHYVISTPCEANAKRIDPQLPTILWFHPVYLPSIIFHAQFMDLSIRKYNLVALDARAHGLTPPSEPLKRYTDLDAAEDACAFMEALKLPPCHIIGNSMGASTALGLAITHPDRVLSVLAIAPLPPTEPQDAVEGREQIMKYWTEGIRKGDEPLVQHASHGALQHATGHMTTPLIEAVLAFATPIGKKNWGTEGSLEQFKILTHDFFVNRSPHPKAELSKITCPIRLVYCTGDVAYTREHFMELYNLLQESGTNVSQVDIANAPHFAPFTHPQEVNAIINAHLDVAVEGASRFPTPTQVQSPFEKDLIEYGYKESSDDEC